jgi:hypothetical protein
MSKTTAIGSIAGVFNAALLVALFTKWIDTATYVTSAGVVNGLALTLLGIKSQDDIKK